MHLLKEVEKLTLLLCENTTSFPVKGHVRALKKLSARNTESCFFNVKRQFLKKLLVTSLQSSMCSLL